MFWLLVLLNSLLRTWESCLAVRVHLVDKIVVVLKECPLWRARNKGLCPFSLNFKVTFCVPGIKLILSCLLFCVGFFFLYEKWAWNRAILAAAALEHICKLYIFCRSCKKLCRFPFPSCDFLLFVWMTSNRMVSLI
jgi:hypothetical protein